MMAGSFGREGNIVTNVFTFSSFCFDFCLFVCLFVSLLLLFVSFFFLFFSFFLSFFLSSFLSFLPYFLPYFLSSFILSFYFLHFFFHYFFFLSFLFHFFPVKFDFQHILLRVIQILSQFKRRHGIMGNSLLTGINPIWKRRKAMYLFNDTINSIPFMQHDS